MKLSSRLLKLARNVETTIGLSIFLGLVGGILVVFQAREISRVIGLVFLSGKTLESVTTLIIAVLVIVLLRVGFVCAGELTANTAARKIKRDLQQRLFTHIMDLGPGFLRSDLGGQETRTGELVNLAIEGMDALEIYFRQYLPQIALAALIPLTILFFVFPSDTLSGLILLLTAPLLPLFMVLIGSVAEKLTRKQWQGLSRMSAYFLDVLQGLTTLKSLGRSRDQIAVIQEVSEHYRQSTMGVLRVTFLSALVLELIATLSTAVVAVEIGIRLLYGRMAFEQAFFLLLLAPEFYLPLRLLGTRFHAGMAGVEAANRIFQILGIPISTNGSAHRESPRPHSRHMPPSILIKDLKFSYSNDQPALHDISFEIPSGKMTALIGESGAGKTTLTWLLLRFLQPHSGEISVDGEPLDNTPVSEWRENLAWVPQDPYLFDDTILANIKLARPDADQAAILQAAQLAHADEFINQMPLGYQTMIGERGVRLSAGQAQRIALARAFLKDTPFIILDEATSYLDPEADVLIRHSLASLALGRTVLVIAHHRATLTMADQVITLRHGKVERIQQAESPGRKIQFSHPIQSPQAVLPVQAEIISKSSELDPNENQQPKKPLVEIRLFKLISPFAGRILLSVFLGFATIASGVGLMATAAYIISAAALHPSIAELQVAIVGVRFFGLSRGVFRYLDRLVSHDVTFHLLARWRVWFYQALEPLAPARLMRYHSGDLLTRVNNDIGTLENFYVRTVAPPLVALLVGLVSFFIMGSFGRQLAWGLLGFLLLAGLGLPLLVYLITHYLGRLIVNQRARLSVLLVDSIQGVADLLMCGQAQSQLERLDQAAECLNRLQARMNGLSALQTAIGSILSNLAMLTVLVLAIEKVTQGQMQAVYLGVVSLIALTCFEAMQPLPIVAQHFDSNRAAASRLYELVDAAPLVIDSSQPLALPQVADLQVEALAFKYPSSPDEDVDANLSTFQLSNISFSLPRGKHIALIGPNGSGKTTLTNLLLRYWEYQHGSIRLGDHEIRNYFQDDIRKYIAVISQNTYLFTATIKENLLIAQPRATDEQIIQACREAQLYDFIQSLPAGLHTWIGEHGLRLSAGERQRLAIARTLLRDSPLLILDEPTANLDPVTELAVLNSIDKLSRARTTIIITQRMVGLESMDEILVLKNGRIVEQGLHQQLLTSRGLYSQMWHLYHQTINNY
ncbi:MAG: thiol reductant ABC exporter subunit CydD [Anaerolineales bacterium]